jgi:hypothetical protein
MLQQLPHVVWGLPLGLGIALGIGFAVGLVE